jgi:hydrophobic/amphiphilic exporter-1 (mainly G- bacteria), HAE1 family
VESPGGRIVRGPSEVGVRTMGRVESIEQFNNIIIKNVGGSPIRVRDVGYAEDGMAERRSFAYYKGARRDYGGAAAERDQHGAGGRRHPGQT